MLIVKTWFRNQNQYLVREPPGHELIILTQAKQITNLNVAIVNNEEWDESENLIQKGQPVVPG